MGGTRTIRLRSGGELKIDLSCANLFALDEVDRAFVLGIADLVLKYEAAAPQPPGEEQP